MLFGDKDQKNLTVFSGVKDRSEARRVHDVIEVGSVRTRLDVRDGERTTVYRTRGGFPEAFDLTFEPGQNQSKREVNRGYVSSLINSEIIASGKKIARIIKKLAGVWKGVDVPERFGPYSVCRFPEGDRDVVVSDDKGYIHVLSTFAGNVVTRKLTELFGGLTAYPYVMPSLSGGVVDDNPKARYMTTPGDNNASWHVFAFQRYGIDHVSAWDAIKGTLYDADELFAGTTGFVLSEAAGVAVEQVDHSKINVGFNALHIAATGSMLQRGRFAEIGRSAPHVALGGYIDEDIQGFIYTFPYGTPNTQSLPGEWLNPINTITTVIAPFYAKVGNPLDQAPNAVYQFHSFLHGAPQVEQVASSATRTTWTGGDSLSYSKNLGWFGVPLSAEITVGLSADHLYEDSTGRSQLVTPTTIANAQSGSTYFPPSWTHQWGPPVNYGTLPAGEAYSPACATGTTIRKQWNTTTTASCMVGGVQICSIYYHHTGAYREWSGTQMVLKNGPYAIDGVAASLVNPSDNTYYNEYNSILWGCLSMVLDNINPVSITTYEPISGSQQSASWSFITSTIDYILFDKPNETYVYLKSEINATESFSTITLKLVVSKNGIETEKVIKQYASSVYLFSIPTEPGYSDCDYFPAPTPFAGFCPPFCIQGAFPYGAYSETGEMGSSVFLMSLPLTLQKPALVKPDPPYGGFVFVPRLFYGMLAYASASLREDFWNGFDNTLVVHNFSDGVFVEWPDTAHAYTPSVSNGTFSEVYRT